MGNVNLHINYTLADIQRYLSGKLSPGEMHEIEKAALLDPFLADALDGYSEAPLPLAAQHLNQIAASLQQPQDAHNAIVAPLPATGARWQWWKVAAMVIIISGAGSLTWKLLQSPAGTTVPQQDLAQSQTVPAPPVPPTPAQQIAPQADSIKPVTTPATAKFAAPKAVQMPQATLATASQNRALPAEERTSSTLSALLAKKAAVAEAKAASGIEAREQLAFAEMKAKQKAELHIDSAQLKETLASGNSSAAFKKMADKSVQYSFTTTLAARAVAANLLRGVVTDDSGSPITGASVKVLNGHAVSITDDKGRFALRTMDTTAKVEISSIGFETRQAGVSVSKNNTILLNAEEESLSDMVVMELHSRKKAAPAATETPVADSLYPAGGWQSFQEYVYTKIHQEMDTTGSNQKGEGTIELEFVIDESGRPRNFKVIHSSDNALNGKAISVLQNGPIWIGDKKKKGRVKVRF
jgi:hypothetical protein